LLTAAMAVASEMLQKPRPGPILRVAFGFFLGAAVLAKGPAAVILAGGATLLWAAFTRQWSAPFRFLHPLIIAVFCATALPWYVLCALRNPEFLRVFIWQHNFERYLTPIFEHRQPFWFYGYNLPLAVLPWITVMLAAMIGAAIRLKEKSPPQSADLFFACWALFPVLFFSLSQSKLPGYILPAIPPLFIVLGRWVSRSAAIQRENVLGKVEWIGALLIILGILWCLRMASSGFLLDKTHRLIAVLVFAIGILLLALPYKKRTMSVCLAIALLVATSVEIANFAVLPRLDEDISFRNLAIMIQPVENIAIYRLPNDVKYGLDFYLNRELPEWEPGQQEPNWILAMPASGLHFPYNPKSQSRIVYGGGHALALIDRR
jgi:4-amino-4-deoxy-L-arabinose transferase-like glycosyltransferase